MTRSVRNRTVILPVCILLVLCLFAQACGVRSEFTTEKISEQFYANKDLYEPLAQCLYDYGPEEFILLTQLEDEAMLEGMVIKKMASYLIASKTDLTESAYREIDRYAAPLFKEQHIDSIYRADTEVRFTLAAKYGKTADIIYIAKASEITTEFEITECVEIEPNWYAVLTSD